MASLNFDLAIAALGGTRLGVHITPQMTIHVTAPPVLSRAPLTGANSAFFAVEYEPATAEVLMLDQRLLPGEVTYHRLTTPDQVADGISAAYALAMVARAEQGDAAHFLMAIGGASRVLGATRPTAVNLAWAIARISRRAADVARLDPEARAAEIEREADLIHSEDVAACEAMGQAGAEDVPDGATILTHCNAGALATGGYGTALGVIRAAHAKHIAAGGKGVRVLADETRPYLQGARLTSWELHADGIPVEVITDGMPGHFFQRGEIDFVVVGSDRIAANGDVANKIGTYGVAVLADAHDVPFTVAAPWSTVDLATPTGAGIPIEERSREEVATIGERTMVADGIPCRHPAFDVTPARLVHAVYTERGTFRPVKGGLPADLNR